MKQLTRRNLFAAAAITAVPLLAASQQTPAAAPAPSSKDEDLKTARELMASNAAQMSNVKLPMSTEPAFVFKVQ